MFRGSLANLAPIPDVLTDEQAAYCIDMLSTGFVVSMFIHPTTLRSSP